MEDKIIEIETIDEEEFVETIGDSEEVINEIESEVE